MPTRRMPTIQRSNLGYARENVQVLEMIEALGIMFLFVFLEFVSPLAAIWKFIRDSERTREYFRHGDKLVG
jgi:hypothetical protein